jgi:sigma-B regulation protein RsbQ
VPVRCIKFPSFKRTIVETNKRYADFNAVLLDEVGHYPMLERPAAFNQKLREILAESADK